MLQQSLNPNEDENRMGYVSKSLGCVAAYTMAHKGTILNLKMLVRE